MDNIVLITVDCLRANHLKYMTKTLKKEPKTIFTNAFSNAPETAHSVPSFLTSCYPPINHSRKNIAEVLKERNYATAAFVPNAALLSLSCRNLRIGHGFDIFKTYLHEYKEEKLRWLIEKYSSELWAIFRKRISFSEIWLSRIIDSLKNIYFPFGVWEPYPKAEVVCEDAMEWLKENNEPFFLWIHLMDVHWPYIPPEGFLKIKRKYANALNVKLHYLRGCLKSTKLL